MGCSPHPPLILPPKLSGLMTGEDIALLMLEFSSAKEPGMYSFFDDKRGLSYMWVAKITQEGYFSLAFPDAIGSIYVTWEKTISRPTIQYLPNRSRFIKDFVNTHWQQCSEKGIYEAISDILKEVLPKLVKYGD